MASLTLYVVSCDPVSTTTLLIQSPYSPLLQLLKIIRRAPGMSDEEIDNEAVLMRAYGNHTEIIIDRESRFPTHIPISQFRTDFLLFLKERHAPTLYSLHGALLHLC